MMTRRTIVLGGLITLAALPAAAQQNPWVGTWKGELGGGRGKKGSERTMVIESVAPDGTIKGAWGADAPRIGNAEFALAGDKLTVKTGQDAQVELTRVGDRKLRGQFRTMTTGRTLPIEMERQ